MQHADCMLFNTAYHAMLNTRQDGITFYNESHLITFNIWYLLLYHTRSYSTGLDNSRCSIMTRSSIPSCLSHSHDTPSFQNMTWHPPHPTPPHATCRARKARTTPTKTNHALVRGTLQGNRGQYVMEPCPFCPYQMSSRNQRRTAAFERHDPRSLCSTSVTF